IMESITSTIRRLVPEIPDEELSNLATYLDSEGYQHAKDLIFLEAEDLKPHLKMFYVRKLLIGVKANSSTEPSNSTATTAVQQNASVAVERPIATSTAVSQRCINEFQVNWADLPEELVKDCENGLRPTPQMRRHVVKVLGTSLAKFNPSPGMAVVKRVARLVTEKYRHSFADLTSAGDVIGDGSASFARQLSTFLENKRRPNRNAKRTVDDLLEQADEVSTKRFSGPQDTHGCVAWQPDCSPETWESLTEKRCLLLQTSLTCPNEISKLMSETYPLQRKDINEGKLTIQNIQELWPNLLEESHFFKHVETLVGFPFCATFIHELTLKGPKIVDYMLKMSKKEMRPLLQKVTSAIDKEGQAVPRHYFMLELLCAFFSEDFSKVVSFHPHAAEGAIQDLPLTPHLAVIGSSMSDINRVVLAVDGAEVISTSSIEKGMGLLLGAFFTFNIAYPPSCHLTMEFLQRYFGQINPPKKRGKGSNCGIAPRLLSLIKAI
ncbi:hypothetical protein MTO96_004587, partial [Rhipicephalus appendiculatus]